MSSLQVLLMMAVLSILAFGGGWYGHYQYGGTQPGAPRIAPGLHLIDPTSLRDVPAAIKEAPLRALLPADALAALGAADTPAGSQTAVPAVPISRPRPVKGSDFVWLSPKPVTARKVQPPHTHTHTPHVTAQHTLSLEQASANGGALGMRKCTDTYTSLQIMRHYPTMSKFPG